MMPVLHSMEVLPDAEARMLRFSINLLAPSAIDQLRVLVLLERRFEGERTELGRFLNAGDRPFGLVGVRFPSAGRYAEAKAFCDAKLTRSGMMIAAERDLLDQADPGTGVASSIMRALYAQPFTDPPHVEEASHRAMPAGS